MVIRAYYAISRSIETKDLLYIVDPLTMFAMMKFMAIFFTLDILISLIKEHQISDEHLGIYLKDSIKFYLKRRILRDIISISYFFIHVKFVDERQLFSTIERHIIRDAERILGPSDFTSE